MNLILNSYLLNWRFKISSGNNHINNYELDELPIPELNSIDLDPGINELQNNIKMGLLYGLNKSEIKYILKEFFELKEIIKEFNNIKGVIK